MSAHRVHIQRPATFLSLAPVQSASYPKAPTSLAVKSPPADNIITEPSVQFTARRHSSTSSVSSQRFLKLGPVHWGGNSGEDDYAIEE
ncbi:hypothetical protein L211DRAFT_822773 [Terfezia boudieri ATCC MYA-4762]|uniref:Uncharacterized protein n=1 Tax=Terfezia boudieri ATCC MYA-4762 TaxID=1051890 RepID=A0A3N4LQR8_9PEZI|nr:hypothetical protein L211DRAFT_822773 [Terfezia boudieri ATCC MYA-4762]